MSDLKQSLLGKYSEQELASAIQAKKEEYSGLLTEEGALSIIARDSGIRLPEKEVEYGDLSGLELGKQVNCVLKFEKLYSEKYFDSNGRKGVVCNVDVSSNGKTAKLVLWNEDASFLRKKGVEKNCLIKAKRLVVKSLDPLELQSTMTTELFLEEPGSEETVKLASLKDGDTVSILCSIIEKSVLREFERDGRKSAVINLIVGDDSGTGKLVCWGDNAVKANKLNPGESIKVEDGVVRNGEVHCSWSTHIVFNPVKEIQAKTTKLFEISDGFSGLVEAEVREVSEPKISNNEKKTLYVRALLTDEKMKMPCVFFNDEAKKFLGITDSNMDLSVLFKLKQDSLIGRRIVIQANAKNNSFSGETELVCNSFVN
ncbi:hypothetical protein HUU53_02835 [Candidatus Micrarchaeota archaeon]|nr:hypothetical protein [Candidatus Micrarchaeota archaeon]